MKKILHWFKCFWCHFDIHDDEEISRQRRTKEEGSDWIISTITYKCTKCGRIRKHTIELNVVEEMSRFLLKMDSKFERIGDDFRQVGDDMRKVYDDLAKTFGEIYDR